MTITVILYILGMWPMMHLMTEEAYRFWLSVVMVVIWPVTVTLSVVLAFHARIFYDRKFFT